MKTIIIYGSQYGTTKRYAEHLSEMTGIEAVAFKEAKNIDKYDRVIFMGALYAGSVLGLRKTVSNMSPKQELVIVTVGLVDRMIQRILTTFAILLKREFLQISTTKRESSTSMEPLTTAI